MMCPKELNLAKKHHKKVLRGCRSVKTMKRKQKAIKRRMKNMDWQRMILPKTGEDDEMAGTSEPQTRKGKSNRPPSKKRIKKIMKARMRAEKEANKMSVDSAPPPKKTSDERKQEDSDDEWEDMDEGENA